MCFRFLSVCIRRFFLSVCIRPYIPLHGPPPASTFNDSKAVWETRLHHVMGAEYASVCSVTLGAQHLIMFARRQLFPSIGSVRTARAMGGKEEEWGGAFSLRANSGLLSLSLSPSFSLVLSVRLI